jgi:hypothetical protein
MHRAAAAQFAISRLREQALRRQLHDSGEIRQNGLHRFYTGIFGMFFSLKINEL